MKKQNFKNSIGEQLIKNDGLRFMYDNNIKNVGHKGCISNMIDIEYNHVFYGEGVERIRLKNVPETWKLLKWFVDNKEYEAYSKSIDWDGNEEVSKLEDTIAYKHRFEGVA